MEYIKNDILDEGYYSINHKSGLKIFVYPKEDYASTYAIFGTKYGSIDTRFKRSDKESGKRKRKNKERSICSLL